MGRRRKQCCDEADRPSSGVNGKREWKLVEILEIIGLFEGNEWKFPTKMAGLWKFRTGSLMSE
jgi:hypothetical protein